MNDLTRLNNSLKVYEKFQRDIASLSKKINSAINPLELAISGMSKNYVIADQAADANQLANVKSSIENIVSVLDNKIATDISQTITKIKKQITEEELVLANSLDV